MIRGSSRRVETESRLSLDGGGLTAAFRARLVSRKSLSVIASELARTIRRRTPVRDGHLCCGSAGTYSLLQPEISARLRDAKLDALQAGGAECIASANIGCIAHLAGGADVPLRHWVELLWADENVT